MLGEHELRLKKLRRLIENKELDAALITSTDSIFISPVSAINHSSARFSSLSVPRAISSL